MPSEEQKLNFKGPKEEEVISRVERPFVSEIQVLDRHILNPPRNIQLLFFHLRPLMYSSHAKVAKDGRGVREHGDSTENAIV